MTDRVRFVHTADWQLGMTRHFLAGEAQSRFTDARIGAVERIGRVAAERDCGFVLVCGDVFETADPGRQVVARTAEALREVPVPVLLLPGNHDPAGASSVYASPDFTGSRPPNVTVLGTPGRHPVPGLEGVEVVAAPWTSKHPGGDPVAGVLDGLPADGAPRVLAGHGCVDVLSPDRDDPARIALAPLRAALDGGRIRYVALGDRHSATVVDGDGRIRYSGAPEPTSFTEVDPGKVLVVDAGPDGVRVEDVKVATWAFHDLELVLEGDEPLDALDALLGGLRARQRAVVRLALSGSLPLADHARLETLLHSHRSVLASLELWDRNTSVSVREEATDLAGLEAAGLSGYALAAARELMATATGGGDGAATAQQALVLLHGLLKEER